MKNGTLPIPAINVNDSVTNQNLITNTVVKRVLLMLLEEQQTLCLPENV